MAFSSILDLWNKWNIRSFTVLSLSLQVFLILFAPTRKKTSNHRIIFLLWLAYLMADWVAAFTVGLISHNQGNSCARAAEVDGALQAFWASFLLLHLGGPDTITAFSLEDSRLWRRHLLSLIFQVNAVIYVFARIFPSDKSLIIPTMLVFLAGIIKNAERLLALNLSSLPRLRESMLSQHMSEDNYNKLAEVLNVPGDGYSDEEEAKLAESFVVKHAYYFFQIFKVLLVDLIFTHRERKMSREYFHKVSAMDALKVISVELHFIYEVLHTKALVIRSKWSYIFRLIAFTNVVMAFVLFNRLKEYWLPKLDVDITYSLFFGGIVVDVIALFMLVFSDWTVAGIMGYNTGSCKLDLFFHELITITYDLRKPRFTTCKVEPNASVAYEVLDTPFIFRRWSECISASNLLSESLKKSPRKMYKRGWCWDFFDFPKICSFPFRMAKKIIFCFHHASETIIKGYCPRTTEWMIVKTKHESKNPFIKKLWIFIFNEVRRKSKNMDDMTDVSMIFEARGGLYIDSRPGGYGFRNLLRFVTNVEYGRSIIIWHLATEMWYNREKQFTFRNEEREFSKILSDYMLYLLFNQPNVVPPVLRSGYVTSVRTLRELRDQISDDVKDVEELCTRLHDFPFETLDSTSILREGIELAQEIGMHGEMKWEAISGVWVEMLSYAATHIRGDAHVKKLSEGGELLVFVWLLMAHFGCFYKPEWGMYRGNLDDISE